MSNVYFWHEDIPPIVFEEKFKGMNALEENWLPSLKDRVTTRVREITGITGKLPERIKTWIHQLCLYALSDILPVFYDDKKIIEPINLDSLPKSQRP